MATPLAVGQSVGPITVESGERYNRTGVLVERGATYDIRVINPEAEWLDRGIRSTAAGNPDPTWIQDHVDWSKRFREGLWFQLIGAVGRRDDDLFAIGTGCVWTFDREPAGTSGDLELCLFANDAWWAYFNNEGAQQVRITRTA